MKEEEELKIRGRRILKLDLKKVYQQMKEAGCRMKIQEATKILDAWFELVLLGQKTFTFAKNRGWSGCDHVRTGFCRHKEEAA